MFSSLIKRVPWHHEKLLLQILLMFGSRQRVVIYVDRYNLDKGFPSNILMIHENLIYLNIKLVVYLSRVAPFNAHSNYSVGTCLCNIESNFGQHHIYQFINPIYF